MKGQKKIMMNNNAIKGKGILMITPEPPEHVSKRQQILESAIIQVTGKRETDYGKPENNFETIAKLWSIYLDCDISISARDVAIMMALLKIARIKGKNATEDSFIDLAGYAACAGEIENSLKESHSNEEIK